MSPASDIPALLHLKVISARKLLVDQEVNEVTLPSLEGYLGILPGHRTLVTALGQGVLSYRREKDEEKIPVRGGYAEVRPESVFVFTQASEDEKDTTPAG